MVVEPCRTLYLGLINNESDGKLLLALLQNFIAFLFHDFLNIFNKNITYCLQIYVVLGNSSLHQSRFPYRTLPDTHIKSGRKKLVYISN